LERLRERIRDQATLTDFCNVYDVWALEPELSFPHRDGGRNLLPFLARYAASLPGAVDAR